MQLGSGHQAKQQSGWPNSKRCLIKLGGQRFKIICVPNCVVVSIIIYLGDGKQSSTINVMF